MFGREKRNLQTQEDLIKARNYILEYGWAKGTRGDRWYGVCALGGISMAAHDGNPKVFFSPRIRRAAKALKRAAGVHFIPGWNDKWARTKEEVIAAFDQAIEDTAPPPSVTVASKVMTWREKWTQMRLVRQAEREIAEEQRRAHQDRRERIASFHQHRLLTLEMESLQTGGLDYEDPPESPRKPEGYVVNGLGRRVRDPHTTERSRPAKVV